MIYSQHLIGARKVSKVNSNNSKLLRSTMKRIFLIPFMFLMFVFPMSVEAAPVGHFILYTPCIAQDGTYRTAVQAIITDGGPLELEYRINGGEWIYIGFVSNGWFKGHAYLPEGTVIQYHYIVDQIMYSIGFQGTDYPECPRAIPKSAEPLFQMWLLTNQDSSCILISEVHPSVERQKALCFPGQDWVAENALCLGWVYDDGLWDCDVYGYGHLPFADLFRIYKRHVAMLEELGR
jgi:hypothetical protein